MTTAPVLLIVFNRPEHTQKMLESLLVQRPSELYVFQDGPRVNNTYDLENCQLIRNVIEEQLQNLSYDIIVHKYYSDINRGCRDAIIHAITSVLEVHESVVIIEDDIVTSPAFLTYMNKALDHYKNNMSVHSISGYSPSPGRFEIYDTYSYDVFASPRLFGWGWGTWRDRWFAVDWSMSYYDEFIRNTAQIEAFNRGGDDMTTMLIDEKEGRSSAWDVQFVFDQFKKHAVSIVPCVSYTRNIGCDGTGTHCSIVRINGNELCQKTTLRWLDTLYFDKRIINLLYNTFTKTRRPLWQKAINYIARKLGKKAPFVIKKKVYA
jgi:hypothetical protein